MSTVTTSTMAGCAVPLSNGWTYGTHSFDRSGTLLPVYVPGQPFDRTQRTRVWKLEEKKTDVNLALRMYRDACQGLFDRMILVSNDSDAEPALEALRSDFPHIMRGVVMPIRPVISGTAAHRRPSGRRRPRCGTVTRRRPYQEEADP